MAADVHSHILQAFKGNNNIITLNINDMVICQHFKNVQIYSKNSKDIVDYVLGKFSKEEREVLNNSCNVINSVIKDFINDVDVEKLKSRYN